jgi:hypothetical protein
MISALLPVGQSSSVGVYLPVDDYSGAGQPVG